METTAHSHYGIAIAKREYQETVYTEENTVSESPSPNFVEVWQCDPLLVVDENEEILYNARTDVEFTADDASGMQGGALALRPDASGFQPWLSVDGHLAASPTIRNLYAGQREGFTVFGHDEEGRQFTWYIGQAAVEFISRQHLPSSDLVAETDALETFIVIVDSVGYAVYSGNSWLTISASVQEQYIHYLELEGTEYSLETVEEIAKRPYFWSRPDGWIYRGVSPSGKDQTWLVGSTARKAMER